MPEEHYEDPQDCGGLFAAAALMAGGQAAANGPNAP